jgi:hypothetical protein
MAVISTLFILCKRIHLSRTVPRWRSAGGGNNSPNLWFGHCCGGGSSLSVIATFFIFAKNVSPMTDFYKRLHNKQKKLKVRVSHSAPLRTGLSNPCSCKTNFELGENNTSTKLVMSGAEWLSVTLVFLRGLYSPLAICHSTLFIFCE